MVANLLLFLEEEEAFWTMCALIEDLVPVAYFSGTLLGVQADQRVLRQLVSQYLPQLDAVLLEHDIGKLRGVLLANQMGVIQVGCNDTELKKKLQLVYFIVGFLVYAE